MRGQPPSVADEASPRQRLVELEAVRGAAALVVLVGHFFDGFVPPVSHWAASTPFEAVLNGPAAVVLFFALSGFVLALHPLSGGGRAVLPGVLLRRWPRLAGTTLIASLGYVAVARAGGFPPFSLARDVPHYPPYLLWGTLTHDGAAASVAYEATAGAFLTGANQHVGVLWTMHWELVGSIVVVGLCYALLTGTPWLRILLFAAWSAAALSDSPWLLPFPAGVALAALHRARGSRLRIPTTLAAALLVVGALCWSWDFATNAGAWAPMASLPYAWRLLLWVAVQTVAALCWIAVALYHPGATRMLRGRLGAFAGRVSFPLYLLHLLVMLSLSAWLYAAMMPSGPSVAGVAILFAVTLAATVAVSLPLAAFDRWWMRRVRRLTPWSVPWSIGRVRAGR